MYRDIDVPVANTDLPEHNAIWVGGAGDLVVVTRDGQTRTFTAVAAGTLLPVQVKQISSTSTATLLLILL